MQFFILVGWCLLIFKKGFNQFGWIGFWCCLCADFIWFRLFKPSESIWWNVVDSIETWLVWKVNVASEKDLLYCWYKSCVEVTTDYISSACSDLLPVHGSLTFYTGYYLEVNQQYIFNQGWWAVATFVLIQPGTWFSQMMIFPTTLCTLQNRKKFTVGYDLCLEQYLHE